MKKQNFKMEEKGLLTELFDAIQMRREEEKAEKDHDHILEMAEEAAESLCDKAEEAFHKIEEAFEQTLDYILHTLKEPDLTPACAHARGPAPRFH